MYLFCSKESYTCDELVRIYMSSIYSIVLSVGATDPPDESEPGTHKVNNNNY